jgi:hypothetical protein
MEPSKTRESFNTSGFWPRVRARALRAPVPRQMGRCAVSYLTPKNILNLSNLGRPRQGPFSFHRNTEAMEYEVHLPPASPIAALLILPAIFWGQNYVPVPPYALIFFWFFFSIVFGSFLFIILFPFYSPFQFLLILLFLSLLILLVGAILRLLFLLLLYFKLFVDLQTCILMIYVHISVILRGFSKGPSLFYLLILLYCTLFFLFLFFSSYI